MKERPKVMRPWSCIHVSANFLALLLLHQHGLFGSSRLKVARLDCLYGANKLRKFRIASLCEGGLSTFDVPAIRLLSEVFSTSVSNSFASSETIAEEFSLFCARTFAA